MCGVCVCMCMVCMVHAARMCMECACVCMCTCAYVLVHTGVQRGAVGHYLHYGRPRDQPDPFLPQILKRGCHVNDRDGLTDMTLLHYACKAGAHGVGELGPVPHAWPPRSRLGLGGVGQRAQDRPGLWRGEEDWASAPPPPSPVEALCKRRQAPTPRDPLTPGVVEISPPPPPKTNYGGPDPGGLALRKGLILAPSAAGDPAAAVRLSNHLLVLGADVTLRSRWTNMNALHYAAYFDVPELIRILLKASKPKGLGRGKGQPGVPPFSPPSYDG